MIYKGIMATTQVDAHNMRITLAALESAAEKITNGECAPIVSVNHDPTIIPIGKIINAHVERIAGDEHGLFFEQEFFSTFSTEVDGTKYILLKSSVDDRPLASNFLESSEKLLVQTDAVNFKSKKDAAAFLKELSGEYDIETGYFVRKSAVPDPELIFQLLETIVSSLFIYLAGKPVMEKVGNHIVDRALAELDSLYKRGYLYWPEY